MSKLKITGFRFGLQKIEMTKILQAKLSLPLDNAKYCTDKVLDGETVSFEIDDLAAAKELADAFDRIGAIVELETE